jgi:hypothetical protein
MQYSSTEKSNRLEIIRSWLNQKPLKEKSGKWYFRYVDNKSETTDSFDRIKLLFKNYPRFYYSLIEIISPVYSDHRSLKKFMTLAKKPILNLGSGNQPKFAKPSPC